MALHVFSSPTVWCQPNPIVFKPLVIQVNLPRSAPYRAGFAQQGAKEKQLLKDNNAFNVSSFVLRAMMSGQYWPEGDEVYHAELTVPILLVHGMHDKFVPVEEDQRMAEVRAGLDSNWETVPTKHTFVTVFTTAARQNYWLPGEHSGAFSW